MSYAVQVLFQDLGVHPTVHEIDKDPDCREIEKAPNEARLFHTGPSRLCGWEARGFD